MWTPAFTLLVPPSSEPPPPPRRQAAGTPPTPARPYCSTPSGSPAGAPRVRSRPPGWGPRRCPNPAGVVNDLCRWWTPSTPAGDPRWSPRCCCVGPRRCPNPSQRGGPPAGVVAFLVPVVDPPQPPNIALDPRQEPCRGPLGDPLPVFQPPLVLWPSSVVNPSTSARCGSTSACCWPHVAVCLSRPRPRSRPAGAPACVPTSRQGGGPSWCRGPRRWCRTPLHVCAVRLAV